MMRRIFQCNRVPIDKCELRFTLQKGSTQNKLKLRRNEPVETQHV